MNRMLLAQATNPNAPNVQIQTQVNPSPMHYVLIAGLNYPSYSNGYKLVGDNSSYVDKRKKEIIASNRKNESIVITTVNLLKGKVIKDTYVNGQIDKSDTKDYDPITLDNYQTNHPYFTFNGKNIIKKWDIYKIAEDLGQNDPGTLMEFGIYSHAYYDGPILVDSDSQDLTNDNDLRRSDINSVDTAFGSSFDKDGIMIVWGCSFPKMLNLLFSKLRRNSKYKLTKIDDTEVFSYPKNHFYVDNTTNPDSGYLVTMINSYAGTSFMVNEKIDLTFFQIKKIAAFNYIHTYAARFANKFDIKVKAALPATYSNVSPNFHIASDTMANVNLYKFHLGITLDNNFGIFDKNTVESFKNLYSL